MRERLKVIELGEPEDGATKYGFTAAELQHMQFPPLKYIVPDYLAEGATLFAGKPKLGKSWMVLDWCLAVAFGGIAFDAIKCEQGDVLYAALEDNERRLQRRLKQRLAAHQEWPARLTLRTEMRRINDGLLDEIREWTGLVEKPRLVVIDTLACVRPPRRANEVPYEADYAAVAPLQALAAELGIAIVIVHHVRKMGSDDPLDTVSGTTGLTGGVDSIIVLSRDGQGTTLTGRGRDLEDFENAVELEKTTGRWRILGNADEARRSKERNAVLKVLRESGEAMGPKDIAAAAGLKYENVRVLLPKMVKDDELSKGERGSYRAA
jgi:hypothetical protein